jgi:hypothetical protein
MSEIRGSQGGEYEDGSLLGCCVSDIALVVEATRL